MPEETVDPVVVSEDTNESKNENEDQTTNVSETENETESEPAADPSDVEAEVNAAPEETTSDTNETEDLETAENATVEENTKENAEQSLVSNEQSPFSMLTPDIVIRIFSLLDIPDLVQFQLVCQEWFAYCRCDTLWGALYDTTDWTLSPPPMELEEATWYDLYRLHYMKEMDQLSSLFPCVLCIIFDFNMAIRHRVLC